MSRSKAADTLRTVRQRLMRELVEFVCEHDDEIRESSSDPSASNYRLQDLDARMLATLNAVCRAESLIAPPLDAAAIEPRKMKTKVFVTRVETEEMLEAKINALLAKLHPAEVADIKIDRPRNEQDNYLVVIIYRTPV
ncbi:MAG: hypothetical protein ACYS8W_06930 [Planctomycetota bacterium]|jgi:hypothetical protein